MAKKIVFTGIAAAALMVGGFGSAAMAAPPEDRPEPGANSVLPTAPLSDAEKTTLLTMVDEERMARDLYSAFAAQYPDAAQFASIANAEQRHYDRILMLVNAYELATPSSVAGTYDTAAVQSLYDDWFAQGSASVDAAYAVGVELESVDIADLKAAIDESDNADLDQAYGRLLAGSENHLAAFEAGADYVPGTHTNGGQMGQGMQDGTGQGQTGQGMQRGQRGMSNGTGTGTHLQDGSCANA